MDFVVLKSLFYGLNETFAKQALLLCGADACLGDHSDVYCQAQESYLYCLSRKKIKHYPSRILLHADEYCSFLVFLVLQLLHALLVDSEYERHCSLLWWVGAAAFPRLPPSWVT